MYEYVKNNRTRRKEDMVYVMGGQCAICGYKRSIHALEFHHLNPSEKEFDFNKAICRNWNETAEELSKCVLLCANCHREIHDGTITQTIESSYDSNKAQEITDRIWRLSHHQDKYCPNCGKIISARAEYCENCSAINRRVTDRPDRDTLKNLIRTTPFVQIAHQYNVSDNSVRKWCIAEHLPSKVSEIKMISDDDWSQI